MKFLIPVLIIVIFVGVYSWYSSSRNPVESSVAGSNGAQINSLGQAGKEKQESQVMQLLSVIQNTKIEIDVFEHPVFKNLQDYSIQFPQIEKGRVNPFAPF